MMPGKAHEESDVDLVVVLGDVGDGAFETERIVGALFDLEANSGRAIEALTVAAADVQHRSRPLLLRAALDEGLLSGRALWSGACLTPGGLSDPWSCFGSVVAPS